MATIAEQLSQLQTEKGNLINILRSKGVEVSDLDTFTELVPKVNDISGGGGEGSSGIYLKKSLEEMQSISNPQENEYCLVIDKSLSKVEQGVSYDTLTFPKEVSLTKPITSTVYLEMQDDMWMNSVSINGNRTRISVRIMSDDFISIEYTSINGRNYTSNQDTDYTIEFSTPVKSSWEWDDDAANFIIAKKLNFEGIFQYSENNWNFADIGVDITSDDIYPNKKAYSSEGKLTGTLFTELNDSTDFKKYINMTYNFSQNITNLYRAFSSIQINEPLWIIPMLNTVNVTNMSQTFSSLYSRSIDISNWDTSNVTDMSSMFSYLYYTKDLNLGNMNTSKVTNMASMFSWSRNIVDLDLSSFNTINVTNMFWMFAAAENISYINLASFDTSNVETMEGMFYHCFNVERINVSNLNTCNVSNMQNMFTGCSKVKELDVSNFDTHLVNSFGNMFHGCYELEKLDVTNWNTSNVTMMGWLFYGCRNLKVLNLSTWDVSNVGSYWMREMFEGCHNLKTIIINNPTLFKLQYNTPFNNTPIINGTGFVYVPDDLVSSYKSAANWKNFASAIKPISELPEEYK